MKGVSQVLLALLLVLLCLPVFSAPVFPDLTGRVVDKAGLLSTGIEAELTRVLARHEQETSNQVVVVTVDSLQGYTIEDYGYQLGRHWGIGQAKLNNGVLLIVAPKERKVRIEVGYGLEGTLTDALSKNIIETVILPKFRANNYQGGIRDGVDSIIKAIAGTYSPKKVKKSKGPVDTGQLFSIFIFSIVIGEAIAGFFSSRVKSGLVLGAGAGVVTAIIIPQMLGGLVIGVIVFFFHIFIGGGGRGGSGWSRDGYGGGYYSGGYGGGGGFGGGGFSGGGGSFGGGGASGGW